MFKNFDIRVIQIMAMLCLLMAGVFINDFSISFLQVALTFLLGLLTQAIWLRYLNLENVGYLSALITCFGTTLLLRSDTLWVHPVSITLAMSSKFLLRYNGRHLFNPAAFGVLFAITFFPGAWISPGQWGFTTMMTLLLLSWGVFVTYNAKQTQISLIFLVSYALMLVGRDLWLGWEFDVTFHKFLNGSLILFSFFMISDPKTSPLHFKGQWVQAIFVAAFSYYFHFVLYWNNAFIYALIFSTPLVIFCNKIWKQSDYRWFSWGEKNEELVHYRI